MNPTTFAAVDLGASSGRLMTGVVGGEQLELTERCRFANRPVRLRDTLFWDVLGLYGAVVDALADVSTNGDPARPVSIGIDSWGVDYGLLDRQGVLLGNPVHHRDRRTENAMERVRRIVGDERLYDVSGLQFLAINTIYQLAAEPLLSRAGTLLLIPDLIAYWLTGSIGAEVTNASTTGLLDVRTRTWTQELAADVGVPEGLLPPLREPGTAIGVVEAPEARDAIGIPVTAVASHDTASAVAAVPASTDRFAYISCGTWSLVGLELPAPVLGPESRKADFTNEGGLDGTIRYLRNVMGLWLLQESMRAWATDDLAGLLSAAAELRPLRSVVDAGSAEFLAPDDMPDRIRDHCARTGQPVPDDAAVVVRCIVDSLALAHRSTIRRAMALAGREVDVVHLVGGGSRNDLLCQATADACGLPVLAGPVEATALGNVLVQARAFGLVGSLAEMRSLVARTQVIRRFEPEGGGSGAAAWDAAASRLG